MIIRLNKNIYTESAVRETIRAFRRLAIFKFKKSPKYFVIEAKNIDQDLKQSFRDEFCNFALGSIKN